VAGKFDYRKRLGAGHFGEVWLVTDTTLDTERAVKVIPPDKVPNQRNFFQESQILQAVAHPNVVQIYEAGTLKSGRLYVAMEYLRKGSLEDEARGAYVPLTRAKRLMIDVLRGLEHSHNSGVIHRDIKPANILIGDNNEGKLSDFGLAIPVGVDLKSLGAKDYAYTLHLAPEVKDPGDYGVPTDIYACGITLYRLVNGDSILPQINPQEARRRASTGQFPERAAYRDFVPRPLRMIINRALNIDPAKRYSSAAAMRHALEAIVIEKNWSERILQNGSQWTCGWNQRCYEVSCFRGVSGKWSVVVRKGPNRKRLRRVGRLSHADLTKEKAKQCACRILQDFVLGKEK
jgi:serine/threonine protein kinase